MLNLEIKRRLILFSCNEKITLLQPVLIDLSTKIVIMRVGWAQLPEAILERLLQQLVLADFIRFGAVCVSWRSVTRKTNQRPRRQLPWLMLYDNPEADAIKFFSPSENRIYTLKLPEPAYCWGAYEGFLMIELSGKCTKNFIFNPMTSEKVRIPPLSALPYTFECMRPSIHTVAISSIPVKPGSSVVVCLYDDGYMALCTPGDREWQSGGNGYMAVMFHNHYLYALDSAVQLWRGRFSSMYGGRLTFTKLDIDLPRDLYFPRTATYYLAKHDGKVWLVKRIWREENANYRRQHVVTRFILCEFNESLYRWDMVDLSGEVMLVLCSRYAKSFLANDTSGAIADGIYLTDETYDLPEVEGASLVPCKDCLLYVFNLKRHSLELYNQGPSAAEQLFFRNNPSIWLSPDPWQRLEPIPISSVILGALDSLRNLPGCLC